MVNEEQLKNLEGYKCASFALWSDNFNNEDLKTSQYDYFLKHKKN